MIILIIATIVVVFRGDVVGFRTHRPSYRHVSAKSIYLRGNQQRCAPVNSCSNNDNIVVSIICVKNISWTEWRHT